MNRKIALVLFCLSGFSMNSALQADGLSTDPALTLWHPVFGIGGGISSTTNLGKYHDFPIINPLTDQFYVYSPTDRNQTEGLFEVFLGAEHPLYANSLFQLGLAYAQTGTFNPKGSLFQGVDSQSADYYTYRYKVITRQLLAQGKLMFAYGTRFYPYLLLGLGGSFNHAYGYSTDVPSTLTYTRSFANKTSSTFAYRLGVGFDVAIVHHLRLGLGYRFANLGGIYNSGKASINGHPVNGSLSQDNLYANEALLQLTYIQ